MGFGFGERNVGYTQFCGKPLFTTRFFISQVLFPIWGNFPASFPPDLQFFACEENY